MFTSQEIASRRRKVNANRTFWTRAAWGTLLLLLAVRRADFPQDQITEVLLR
jgi:hypothetical protein